MRECKLRIEGWLPWKAGLAISTRLLALATSNVRDNFWWDKDLKMYFLLFSKYSDRTVWWSE